ncbi:MAG: hypothetical protein ACOZF0_07415 [Thermodesulfobacteriota bacterium]
MRFCKNIVLIAGIVLGFTLIGLGGMGFYLHSHPEWIKPTIERALSTATGAACTIERFAISLQPLAVEAGGICFTTRPPHPAASMEIPFIRTELALEGPFGRKTLLLKNMRVTGISLTGALPVLSPVEPNGSFPAGLLQGLAGFFFFRDIRFQSGEILDGRLAISRGDYFLQARQLHAEAGADRPLCVSFALEVGNNSRHLQVTAPRVSFSGDHGVGGREVTFSGVLRADNISLQTKGGTEIRDIPMGDIRFAIPDGRLDLENGAMALPKVRFDALGLKNLVLDMDVKDGGIHLLLQGKKTALLPAAAARQLLPRDLALAARDAFRMEVAGPQGGPWRINAAVTLSDLALQNKDGRLTGEKISLAASARGVVDPEAAGMTFDAELSANTGEILYDRYYLNLAQNPVVSACKGTCRFQEGILRISRLRFELTDILPVEIRGSLTRGAAFREADVEVSVPRVPMEPVFHHLLREPHKTENPVLETLATGGTLSAECRLRKRADAWLAEGRIGWRGGELIEKGRGVSAKGIFLDLPFRYETGLPAAPAENLPGRLEIRSLVLPPLPEQALDLVLNAGTNRISVDAPTVIRIPGGELLLGAVEVRNLFSPDVSVHTRLAFDGIDIRSFLAGIGAIPAAAVVAGRLGGVLDPVRYERHAVTSQGEITAIVFGGNIWLSDLGASGIFTAAPVLRFNAGWNKLQLSQMTSDTAFGRIEGVLKGHIRDGEIAWGQPQRFDLLLETVKEKGIPQTISIAAVDNIARIGGGQSPFMGIAGAFAAVLDPFPYEKIGIRARLENDMFMINGTIREGGTEYLVKRRGFSGVDIVNQNPDNRINFKDMVKRIQRIAHQDGAVIQ